MATFLETPEQSEAQKASGPGSPSPSSNQSGEFPRAAVPETVESGRWTSLDEYGALRLACAHAEDTYRPLLGSLGHDPLVNWGDRETLLSLFYEADEGLVFEQVEFALRLAANRGCPRTVFQCQTCRLHAEIGRLISSANRARLSKRLEVLESLLAQLQDTAAEFVEEQEVEELLDLCDLQGESRAAGALVIAAVIDECAGSSSCVAASLARLKRNWTGFPKEAERLKELVELARGRLGPC